MPLQTFLRILDAIMKIFDSLKKAKISTNDNRSLGEIDSNLLLWLWGVQDFSGGNNCRYGGNFQRTRIRSGAWRYVCNLKIEIRQMKSCFLWMSKRNVFVFFSIILLLVKILWGLLKWQQGFRILHRNRR